MHSNEAEREAYDEEDEDMPGSEAERDLADDAQWKLIQKNTFTRWANEHLKTVNKQLTNLETELTDGLRLIGLVEVLSGKKFKHVNKRPNFRTQKLENVTMVLKFLEEDEGIRIVNIDSSDIVDQKLKLVLGLIWTLILHYSISMPMWEGEEQTPTAGGPTPKQRLMNWIQGKCPDIPINNFTTDWNNGKAIGALVDACGPGLCPDWEDWDPKNKQKNAKEAMDAAEKWLDVPQLIKPTEMTNPKVDEMSMMTYLSQFPNCKLKPGAPLRPRLNANRVRAYGPGLEPKGNKKNQLAKFTVETFSAGKGGVEVMVLNPKGKEEKCEVVFKNDRNLTYDCAYTPSMEGTYKVLVKYGGKEIPKSPFSVNVEVAAGDPSKVKVSGPGVEKTGNVAGKATYFQVFTKDAGEGIVEVVITDPQGNKNTVKPKITKEPKGVYKVEYTALVPGLHSVNVIFSGQPIPNSPFGVTIASAANAKLCYASGRGIQPKGIRVKDVAEFKIHTKGAGEAEAKVNIVGPGGKSEHVTMKKLDANTYSCTYNPNTPGNYVINVLYGDQHITKSPFKVEVGPFKISKIKAYGPGLEGGVAGQPAVFVVETHGETGALGFSIEGPSQAKIDCKDNGDGSADITYWPTVPGEYAVHILCDEEDIPKSPYMAEIVPSTTEVNAAKVVASGPGLQPTGVQANSWAEFTVDCKKAGKKAPLKVTCTDADGNLVEVQVKDNKNGTYSCKYKPTKNIKHVVLVSYGGVNVPNSPFRVFVQSIANVKVYGPGVEPGVKTFKETYFIIDCKDAGPGDIAITLTDQNGLDVPVQTVDNQDGTIKVTYEAKVPGTYTVNVFFAEKEIPSSPIKVKVESSIDLSKVKVQGLEKTQIIGKERDINIITTGAGKAEAKVQISSPTGVKKDVPITANPKGYDAKFALLEPGPHKVHVTYGDQPVPDSPFLVDAIPDPIQKVKAYGPGLSEGQANKPAEFTIDSREAGPAPLGVAVQGPVEAKIDIQNNPDGTCGVSYLPTVPGDYNVNVTYADAPIPGSPFTAKITPGLDVSGVTASGPGVSPDGVFLDSPADFTVDASSVTKSGQGKVNAVVTSPLGSRAELPIQNNEDGTYSGSYMPLEQGPYAVNITYDDLPIPNSPFTTNAVPGCDPSRVKAYGPGLEQGVTNEDNFFTVETRGAGQGSLGLAIDGPSEAKMTCKDNKDGTCEVDYLPTKPGDYDISVKLAEQHIPGSPFHVKVETPVDPTKVKCFGPGIDTKEVRANVPATFTVDTSDAGVAPLDVAFTDQSGLKRPAEVIQVTESVYQATYMTAEEGKCTVEVKYANQHVPDSPFHMTVEPLFDASKVRVVGPGVGDVPASLPVTFTIDTTEAGMADLEVVIQRPDGTFIRPIINDNEDGTFTVGYTPEDIGPYTIKISFGGQEVPGSPFNVNSMPTGDASKCRIMEGLERTVVVKKETIITVDAAQAGTGKVTCKIRTPSGSDLDIDIVENPDGTFSILFTPQFPGTYSINIKFGGQCIPEGEYTVQAVTAEEYEAHLSKVGEDLIQQDVIDSLQTTPGLFHPVDFCIHVGPIFNFVSAFISMPSGQKAYPKIEDNKDGTVTVRYQPTETGLHELHVHYNNEPIVGSPFQFHVDAANSGFVTAYGPGLSHGTVNEQAAFTIVTKDAGAGGLSLSIEGPSKAEINCVDNKDGTCTVTYVPSAPGEYNITVKFADKNISGSPFKAKITPAEPKRKAQISVGSSSEVSLKVTETDITNLTASIKSPSGREEPCILKKLANGHLGISFTPHEVGEHLVNVYRNNQHIANSPFKIYVGEGELGNAGKVKVSGRGLYEGMANEVNEFIVDTKEAGYGGLSLSIEGPSKADIECHDDDDGTCRVTYKPTEPGTYIINIKFADEHVPGSPFNVKIGGEPSSRITERITRHREAADITHIGSQCELCLKIPGTSPFDMSASVTSPSGITELCDVVNLDDCHYSIKFVPKEMGVHTVSVKHKDMHIPGSPFEFTVGPITGGGAHKVHAAGPGLEKGEVDQACEFNIYTREAGAGGLSIAVEGPSKAEIDFEDRKDGSCGVNYVCSEAGEYLVSVKFNDQHIPDSPFRVQITPSIGDARKLSVSALQEKGLQVNKPAAFKVSFNGARGKLQARVIAPSGAEDEALVQEIDEAEKDSPADVGEYAVRFIPRENGAHYVHVTFEGCHILGSPFRILVGKVDADPGKVTATGDGLHKGQTGQVSKFIVSTVNAGSGALAVTVEGPSKVKLDCREVDEGYEFSYTPSAPGDYLITIRYAGVHIVGSPFKARVEGAGRASGLNEQASVVVETVTKTSTTTKFSGLQKFQSDASKVVAKGVGLKKAFRGKTATFTVDTSGAGTNIMYVGMRGPKTPCDELVVKHTGNNQYTINYTVKERGDYILIVKWGDEHIPGSPFCVEVQ